jgi:anaerobic ribonucleoside-triphosphate reductase activating protein
LNYAEIKYNDIANGVGVRVSIFVSGCTHRCKNCFNSVAWDFNYGKPFTDKVKEQILDSCSEEYIAGISLLGGEPFEPENQPELLEFLKEFKERFPQKTVWCYSGYTYEQLKGITPSRARISTTDDMLNHIDVLVDGKFVEELHSITLRFRGSSNQRLIDLNETRKQCKIVLWDN